MAFTNHFSINKNIFKKNCSLIFYRKIFYNMKPIFKYVLKLIFIFSII